MDEELKKENHRAYTYHFYFNHGLFEEILHLKDFIVAIDEHLIEKLKITANEEDNKNTNDPRFNADGQYGIIFPNILWKTTFLHSYFLLESSLDQICDNIKKAEGHKISLKDFNGRGIQRASLYLKKLANVSHSFETNTWSDLVELNKIRNIFVHSDGNIDISDKKALNFQKRFNGLYVYEAFDNEYLSLSISKQFTLQALDTIERFFNDIFNDIQKNYHN